MNANVNYIGMVNLLCALRDASIISEAEARSIFTVLAIYILLLLAGYCYL